MTKEPVSILLLLVFLYPLIRGFILKFSSRDLKQNIKSVVGTISLLISLCLGIYISKEIFINHDKGIYITIYNFLPLEVTQYLEQKTWIIYIIIMPITIFILNELIYLIMNFINGLTFYAVLDSVEEWLRYRGSFIKRIIGSVFELPRAICYVILMTFILNFVAMMNLIPKYDKYLYESQTYNFICKQVVIPVTNSSIAKKLPLILDNSLKIVIKDNTSPEFNNKNSRVIIYYNGITLDEGIKSNKEIDNFSRRIINDEENVKEKAKALYKWIGSEIEYDTEKASKILGNSLNEKSGAIPTFDTKKGICFDYACLYVAMCRANGIKVRLITGKGFDGRSWVGHAWNQVYIKDSGEWINVDTTFSKGGNYFDSMRFKIDHKEAKVAGEW